MSWTGLSGWAMTMMRHASAWVYHQEVGDRANMLYNTQMMKTATDVLHRRGVFS